MGKTSVIRNADWVVAWDEAREEHVYRNNADVAFQDGAIVFVGPQYPGEADEVIDGAGRCVLPGLIDMHSHTFGMSMEKGFVEDAGSGRAGEMDWYSNIFTFTPAPEFWPTCMEFALAELMRSGVTTLVEAALPMPGLFHVADRSGMRVYFAPMFTSTVDNRMWDRVNDFSIDYPFAEDEGIPGMLEVSGMLRELAEGQDKGLVTPMMMPAQLETTTPKLLRSSMEAAREMGTPMHVHAAYNVHEFQEITRRHGVTPIRYLHDAGVLNSDLIIAHSILLDHHRECREWGTLDDLGILADSGASIVHCPTYYARHFGRALEDFGRYTGAGVNVTLGTDTYPHNLLEEMRLAVLCGRVVSGRTDSVTTSDIFNAVTINASHALKRADIGRLAAGAKADLVVLDLEEPNMKPVRDPLRSVVFAAAERAVRDVYVNGERVVRNGEVLTLDYRECAAKLDGILASIDEMAPQHDWQGRGAEAIRPLALRRA